MLLGIYLGTSIVSFTTVVLYGVALSNKIKRDGYKAVKRSSLENLIIWLKIVFKSFLPIYNVLNTIELLCSGDKYFEQFENELLEKGEIYKPQNNSNYIHEEKKSKYTNTNVVSNEKKYEDMTTKEKLAYLEQERERLLVGSKEKKTEQKAPVFKKTFNYNNK